MIERELTSKLKEVANYYPIVTLTGPRQSGKTTLLKKTFSDLPYVLLETPDVLDRALNDPRLFFEQYPSGAVLDEIQNAPLLFSYLQGIVDADKSKKFILSGSQNFLLLEKISQTLAGRTSILNLMPLSLSELTKANLLPVSSFEYILNGSYPRVYDSRIPPHVFYPDYIQTYIERDVRSIKNIGDLNSFRKFLQLCAGRIGQILNYESLANDTGISLNTAKSWISILEASYIIQLLQPHHANFNKRLVKRPKLYFLDTGVACSLLRIENAEQLITHHARGHLFENFVLIELLKARTNNAKMSNLYFWRDNSGKEIDCIIEDHNGLIPLEIKSGSTYSVDFFKHIAYWNRLSGNTPEKSFVVYGGSETQKLSQGNLTSWKDINKIPIS